MDQFNMIIYMLSSLLTTPVNGFLLSGPDDTTGSEGDTVQLNCRSNLTTTVRWILGHPGTIDVRVIFEATSDNKGFIYPYFKERFSCVRQQDGFQNLVITNVNLSDTGNYTCIDDEGFGFHPERFSYGRWGTATLIVIGVFEKEKMLGHDPYSLDEAPFGEYNSSGRPDTSRSRVVSLDSKEMSFDSDTDSLWEYEDHDASKFNEDGSFIGFYRGKNQPKPDATSLTAVNTFV